MRCLKRNKRPFFYATYESEVANTDEYGFETGETTTSYTAPRKMWANISPASGRVNVEMFGDNLTYDKVIVTDDMRCPITETSVLWVDTVPGAQGDVPYDYIVRRVARSLNSISIAISRVEVSP